MTGFTSLQDPAVRARLAAIADGREGGSFLDGMRDAPEPAADRLVDGATFVLDAPTHVPAVWGQGTRVLWSEGELMLLVGPAGVGKSTLAQQIVAGRLGVSDVAVCGLPVARDERRVLYVAADRPPQIARSMRRMVTEEERELYAERLRVWRGPLDFDLLRHPHGLLELAQRAEAGTVVVDSLKDVASPLTDDAVGQAVKNAMTALTEAGIEVLALHHQRKSNADNPKPSKVDDVYGSTWITAGAGSVVLLAGQAGDPVVDLRHLKQPAEEVGPLQLVHDHDLGRTSVKAQLTVEDLLRDATNGMTAREAADTLATGRKATDAQLEKARRALESLVRKGLARRVDGVGQDPHIYARLVVSLDEARGPRGPKRGPSTPQPTAGSTGSTNADGMGPRAPHGPLADQPHTAPPPIGGRVGAGVDPTDNDEQVVAA